jgi:hypothetical protein
MKKILFSFFILSSICTHAQVDSLQKRVIEPPDSTGFGVPDGEVAAKEIGPSGGTIISHDGRVELIFPAGALTASTNITIQPTTNLLPHGAGNAYQFEPSGIHFKKPVEVIFHYSAEQAEACPPELMGFGMQDQNGKWSSFEYDDWDSTARTLKGLIHHFSYFTDVKNLMIRPEKMEIAVNQTTYIMVLDKGVIVGSGTYKGDYEVAKLYDRNPFGWFVNGIPNGDEREGTMQNSLNSANASHQRTFLGLYHAPRILTKTGFADVKLAVQYYSKKLKKKVWGHAACSILLYDAYRISIIDDYPGRAAMESVIIDSGSFTIIVYRSPTVYRILDIKNYDPILFSEGRNGPFKEKVFTKDAQGSVHITQAITNYEISDDYPPKVNFGFEVSTILKYKFQISARGAKSPVTPLYGESIPQEIHFLANGQQQRYEQGGKYKYEVIIKPCSYCAPLN